MDEVVHDEHLHARGFLQWQSHPDEELDSKFDGKVAVHHSPLRFWGSHQRTVELQRKDIDADRATIDADWLEIPSPAGHVVGRNAER